MINKQKIEELKAKYLPIVEKYKTLFIMGGVMLLFTIIILVLAFSTGSAPKADVESPSPTSSVTETPEPTREFVSKDTEDEVTPTKRLPSPTATLTPAPTAITPTVTLTPIPPTPTSTPPPSTPTTTPVQPTSTVIPPSPTVALPTTSPT